MRLSNGKHSFCQQTWKKWNKQLTGANHTDIRDTYSEHFSKHIAIVRKFYSLRDLSVLKFFVLLNMHKTLKLQIKFTETSEILLQMLRLSSLFSSR